MADEIDEREPYADDLLDFETEQVFQDHEGADDYEDDYEDDDEDDEEDE